MFPCLLVFVDATTSPACHGDVLETMVAVVPITRHKKDILKGSSGSCSASGFQNSARGKVAQSTKYREWTSSVVEFL